jgi:hypothetical protein
MKDCNNERGCRHRAGNNVLIHIWHVLGPTSSLRCHTDNDIHVQNAQLSRSPIMEWTTHEKGMLIHQSASTISPEINGIRRICHLRLGYRSLSVHLVPQYTHQSTGLVFTRVQTDHVCRYLACVSWLNLAWCEPAVWYGGAHQNYCNAANFSAKTKYPSGYTNLYTTHDGKTPRRHFLIKKVEVGWFLLRF